MGSFPSFQTAGGTRCRLRTYQLHDVDALQRAADDPSVSMWMLAAFPYPYTRADAERWISATLQESPARNFVIEAGDAVGNVDLGESGLPGARPAASRRIPQSPVLSTF